MYSSVFCWLTIAFTTLSTFSAPVGLLAAVNIHCLLKQCWVENVLLHGVHGYKLLSQCVNVRCFKFLFASTHCTYMVLAYHHVNAQWYHDFFNLHFNGTFTCTGRRVNDSENNRDLCQQQESSTGLGGARPAEAEHSEFHFVCCKIYLLIVIQTCPL